MTDPQDTPESVEELRTHIDQTRDELAGTVSALAAKADVKGRAQDKALQARDQAQQLMAEKPWLALTLGAGGVLALILATWFSLKRRKS